MFASYPSDGRVRLLVSVGVLLTMFVMGCGSDAVDPSGMSEEELAEDAYRDGFALACEDSGRDTESHCEEIVDRTIKPQGPEGSLPDDVDFVVAQALGYVDACNHFYYGCDPRQVEREAKVAGITEKPCPKSLVLPGPEKQAPRC